MSGIFDIFKSIENDREAVSRSVSFIVACLGNPGSEYERTRHNAGFMCADRLAEIHGIRIDKKRFGALCGDVCLGGKRALIIKPQMFMNLSGNSVCEAMDFYKLDPTTQLLVIYDDIYLDVGRLRIRAKGSDGGHNGIKSINECLGCDEYARIRIGVGKPPVGHDLPSWVLGRFPKELLEDFSGALERAAEATELIVGGELSNAMNKYSK